MSKEFGENLKRWLKNKKMSQRKFAKGLGISQGLVAFWIRGDREPNKNMEEKICSFLNVEHDILFKENKDSSFYNEIIANPDKEFNYGDLPNNLKKLVSKLVLKSNGEKSLESKVMKKDVLFKRMEMFRNLKSSQDVQNFVPLINDESIDEDRWKMITAIPWYNDCSLDKVFAYEVKDEDNKPYLLKGDIAILKEYNIYNNKELCLIKLETEYKFRRVYFKKEDNIIVLKSDNQDFDIEVLKYDKVKIEGAVIGIQRRI